MKPVIIGMLAHVDAGKTTLSEAMLFLCGKLRKLGRVDHGTAFLDYDSQERDRGITIFSKEAILPWKNSEFTLLDTPGHVDFSAEMERTLQVLDAAVIVISGIDGVQAHTETIWRLLRHYHIPVFLFVNKMDIAHQTRSELMHDIQHYLDPHCVDFTTGCAQIQEEIAMCSDELLDVFMETGRIAKEEISKAVASRMLFPCYFGSALKLDGIEALLDGLDQYIEERVYPEEFCARVYKISHDDAGNRLTHIKLTGGLLKSKSLLETGEKIDQIRRYHGNTYEMVQEITAGYVCALKGITQLQAGETLGNEHHRSAPVLSSYMSYHMILPEGMDAYAVMKQLHSLAEEDPALHIRYDALTKEIFVQVRGEIQIEILQNLLRHRFQLEVSFDEGRIAYRETISAPVEGVGHYEPLRHYAEVHVWLEPLPRNSGLQFASICPIDQLNPATQRMILSYLQQEELLGVLSGSMLTDMRITLLGGRAHPKHTSGGDFREAARRAVRQGLKMAESLLLEPSDEFRLEIPNQNISRVHFDLDQNDAIYEHLDGKQGMSLFTGSAPTRWMKTYVGQVRAFTKGKGTVVRTMNGYVPVKQQEKIIHELAYDSESDLHHPTGSIFCEHGAGTYVPWNEVYDHMHVDFLHQQPTQTVHLSHVHRQITIDDEELRRVTANLHQPRKKWKKDSAEKLQPLKKQEQQKPKHNQQNCLLVDGYNMIFAWPELKELANETIEGARSRLLRMLASYQGFRNIVLIVVFDAYKTDSQKEHIYQDHTIYVVYTKARQTADTYIEKATHAMAKDFQITVATSDAQEQNIILGQGATRMSAQELYQEVTSVHQKGLQFSTLQPSFRHMALEELRKLNEDEKSSK